MRAVRAVRAAGAAGPPYRPPRRAGPPCPAPIRGRWARSVPPGEPKCTGVTPDLCGRSGLVAAS